MRRFYVEDMATDAATVSISGPEFVHLKKVLRLKAGDALSVFDGRGLEHEGVIEALGKDSAVVRVTGRVQRDTEPRARVTLLQGLVKKDKPELIVEKATELGVSEVVFYPGQRSVASVPRQEARLLRLRKVAVGAAKQCGRSVVPLIRYAPSLAKAVQASAPRAGALRLMALERAHEGPFEPVRGLIEGALKKDLEGVIVLVGPEGGLTGAEAEEARKEGFSAISLGPRTLRSETAAVALLSILQFVLEAPGPA